MIKTEAQPSMEKKTTSIQNNCIIPVYALRLRLFFLFRTFFYNMYLITIPNNNNT